MKIINLQFNKIFFFLNNVVNTNCLKDYYILLETIILFTNIFKK